MGSQERGIDLISRLLMGYEEWRYYQDMWKKNLSESRPGFFTDTREHGNRQARKHTNARRSQ